MGPRNRVVYPGTLEGTLGGALSALRSEHERGGRSETASCGSSMSARPWYHDEAYMVPKDIGHAPTFIDV
jgi:hypothetical protein